MDLENQYYNSKGLLADSDLQGALDGFKEVVTMEDEKGEWGFKAHKQMVRAVHPPRTLPRAARNASSHPRKVRSLDTIFDTSLLFTFGPLLAWLL